jgi:hypothetical protein
MKISYAILCSTEEIEIKHLIDFLLKNKRQEDEIVVVQDISYNTTQNDKDVKFNINKFLRKLKEETKIKFDVYTFNNDFSAIKNYLNSLCSSDYIFQLDADEIVSEGLIYNLPDILDANKNIDLFLIPRINTVIGLTLGHVIKWGWIISKLDDYKENSEKKNIDINLIERYNLKISETSDMVSYFSPIINFPDPQTRIYKNKPEIKWKNKVHEQIIGFDTFASLPHESEFCILHYKEIKKQERQNELYRKI